MNFMKSLIEGGPMTDFRYMKGIVYIFENHEVQRVSVHLNFSIGAAYE